MIAEVISVEIKKSKVTGNPYLLLNVLCDGNMEFLFISPRAHEFFRLLCAFACVSYDFGILDPEEFIGKLIPSYIEPTIYNGKFYNRVVMNINGMQTCLCSYDSPIEADYFGE